MDRDTKFITTSDLGFRGINLACGDNLCLKAGWINADHCPSSPDVQKINVLNPLPFKDASFDVVYHSQFLEHLSRDMAPAFLRECYRILKPNGVLRVVTPDLAEQAKEYLHNLQVLLKAPESEAALLSYEWIRLEMLDQLYRHHTGGEMVEFLQTAGRDIEDYLWQRMGRSGSNLVPGAEPSLSETSLKKILRSLWEVGQRWMAQLKPQALRVGEFRLSGESHLCMYDEYLLARLLEEVGFSCIKKVGAKESRIPNWNRTLLDCDDQGYPDCVTSLFMEASRTTRGL